MAVMKSTRSVAIDWMRGIVMVLMTIDHASLFYNAGRVADDSALGYVVGSALPPAQFFTRWITHLCAPTFVFLTGTSLALSVARKQRIGVDEASISRDFYIRGAFIALLDLTYMSTLAQHLLLQVLYAIGASMMLMGVLRRLPTRVCLALSLFGIVGGELITLSLWDPHGAPASLPIALTLAPLFSKSVLVIYPVLPWLWLMLLGWTFGRFLLRPEAQRMSAARLLSWSGVASLSLFALVRGANGYGNVMLYREDNSLVQWLHVSKYPPGLAYVTLELGVMALCLAALMKFEQRVTASLRNPILVFGQTSLFFYVTHQLMLGGPATALGIRGKGDLGTAYLAAALALCVLYPLCLWFRGLKARHPNSLLRYV
jgi:uncharacterized membrane protein